MPQLESLPLPQTDSASSVTLDKPSNPLRDSTLGGVVPFSTTVQLSRMLCHEQFHVVLQTPEEDPGKSRFAQLVDKIREQGKEALSVGEELRYSDIIAKATFPDNRQAQELAVKWVDHLEFGLQDLRTLEKIDLAYHMGQKVFPEDRIAAARYAANCFGLIEGHEKFELAWNLFSNYSPLPKMPE